MAVSRTKKDLKKNDKNPFEAKIQKPNPFQKPTQSNDTDVAPTLNKKIIKDVTSVRLNKEVKSQLKMYAIKNDYQLLELYEVAIFEFIAAENRKVIEFGSNSTTAKIPKELYLKIRELKYESLYSQSDILSSAIHYYLEKNDKKGD